MSSDCRSQKSFTSEGALLLILGIHIRELAGVLEKFHICIQVMVTWIRMAVEIHQAIWLGFLYFYVCCCWVASVVSDFVWPHRRQPIRLHRPWDTPGRNTGVRCHFLLQCMKGKSESEVAQSCPTLSDPMDCNPPGSPIHGIFQARVLEWGAIAFSDFYV